MPSIQPGNTVLVTGANGYVATWIVQKLLDAGYSVRGTVRSASKGAHLKEFFKSYGARFRLVIVSDFTQDGAFDTCVIGVSAIIHTATPMPNPDVEDPQEYIKPAVEGTMGILRSAASISTVKRVIYTSTLGTVAMAAPEAGSIRTDKDWNEASVKTVEELGAKASHSMKYNASKVLAEKAAWSYYEKHKNILPYDFLVMNPPYIFGPELATKASSIQSSTLKLWKGMCIDNPEDPRADELLTHIAPHVDVRDVAEVHVSALAKENAAGVRFLLVSEYPSWQHWCKILNPTAQPYACPDQMFTVDALNEVKPTVAPSCKLPKGKPGIKINPYGSFDTSNEACIIGTKFKTIEETVKDTLIQFVEKGLL